MFTQKQSVNIYKYIQIYKEYSTQSSKGVDITVMSLMLRMHKKTSGGKRDKEEKCLVVPLDVRIGPQKKMGPFLYNTVMEDAMM